MRLLHTSDWHLGRMLYAKKERIEEHTAFLAWLLAAIEENAVDLLLVAGDVFDTSLPSNVAQKMYYDFLLKVRNSGCRNVIVVGGNHDSPSFLNAPKEILSALNVRVVGNTSEDIDDELITIKDADENPVAIVCAVPFLRERDISRFVEGEAYGDRSKRIAESVKKHYAEVAEAAEKLRKEIGKNLPIIATGHLSVAGGLTVANDGVRETYIGNIECLSSDIFPKTFDYVALGHYHIPSKISETVRYSGSPIPMGFGEAKQKKRVYIVDFENQKTEITALEIPVFQRLESIQGDKVAIENALEKLKLENDSVWVEIIYDGNDVFPDLTAWTDDKIADTKIEIINRQNRQYYSQALTQDSGTQQLGDLDKFEVFDRLLENSGISDEQKANLKNSYNEIVTGLTIENE